MGPRPGASWGGGHWLPGSRDRLPFLPRRALAQGWGSSYSVASMIRGPGCLGKLGRVCMRLPCVSACECAGCLQ